MSLSKPAAFVILTALATLSAGLFGALHNQLSYSVGATYFHAFMFSEFGLTEALRNRFGAAWIGWQDCWWKGLLVGVPAFALGLVRIDRPARLLAAGIGAIGAVVLVSLFFAMGGLLIGMIGAGTPMIDDMAVPAEVTDRGSFLRAALMHDGARIGGLVGVLAALLTIWRAGDSDRRMRQAAV